MGTQIWILNGILQMFKQNGVNLIKKIILGKFEIEPYTIGQPGRLCPHYNLEN